MPKPTFNEIAAKFNSQEDAMEYFILVENYEIHLPKDKLTSFLNAGSINEMLEMLSEKQLHHAMGLIKGFSMLDTRSEEGRGIIRHNAFRVSDWFYKNVIEQKYTKTKEKGETKTNETQYYSDLQNACHGILKKTSLILKNRITNEEHKKQVKANYKANLKNFDGNSIEYRKWIILQISDPSIPAINTTFNTAKLLKNLDKKRLEHFPRLINTRFLDKKDAAEKINNFEPYFYENMIDYEHLGYIDPSYRTALDDESEEWEIWEKCAETLKIEIQKIISHWNLPERKTLSRSYDDVIDFKHPRGQKNIREENEKLAVGRYSDPGEKGTDYFLYLRKGCPEEYRHLIDTDPRGGNGKKFRGIVFSQFWENVLKVRSYFLKHPTKQDCIVYRGMKPDGMINLLKTARPTINSKLNDKQMTDELVAELNEKQPIMWDASLLSTSFIDQVSAARFYGKMPGNLFFIIEVPRRSFGLTLGAENIPNIPTEEEFLLMEKTKIKILSVVKTNDEYYEIHAKVVK